MLKKKKKWIKNIELFPIVCGMQLVKYDVHVNYTDGTKKWIPEVSAEQLCVTLALVNEEVIGLLGRR